MRRVVGFDEDKRTRRAIDKREEEPLLLIHVTSRHVTSRHVTLAGRGASRPVPLVPWDVRGRTLDCLIAQLLLAVSPLLSFFLTARAATLP